MVSSFSRMAPYFPQTLTRSVHQSLIPTGTTVPALFVSRYLSFRSQSTLPEQSPPSDPTHVDSSPSESEKQQQLREEALAAVQRIEDVIHSIIVRRSAPAWLPFRPGASYWVPPRRRSYGVAEMIENLSSPVSSEDPLSFLSGSGLPSSDFFLDHEPSNPPEVEATSKRLVIVSQPEEEEG